MVSIKKNSSPSFGVERVIFKISFIKLTKTLFPNEVGALSTSEWLASKYIQKFKSTILKEEFCSQEVELATGSIYDGIYYQLHIINLYQHLATNSKWSNADMKQPLSIKLQQHLPSKLLDNFSPTVQEHQNIGDDFRMDETPFYICFKSDYIWIDCNFYQISVFNIILKNLMFLFPASREDFASFPPHPFPILPSFGISFIHYFAILDEQQLEAVISQSIPIGPLTDKSNQTHNDIKLLVGHTVPNADIKSLRSFHHLVLFSESFKQPDQQLKSDTLHIFVTTNFSTDSLQLTQFGAAKLGHEILLQLLEN